MVLLGMGTGSEQVQCQSEASLTVDVVQLCKYASVGAEEAEGKQTGSDGVRGRWKKGGARKERRKEMKKERGEVIP